MAGVQPALKYLEQWVASAHALMRRHWQRALRVREKLRFSEEAFHLVLAGGVGFIGGFVNVVFHAAITLTQKIFVGRTEDIGTVAEGLVAWQRPIVTTLGALAAGLILYWGLRLVGKQSSTNIMEVVATSDGKLPFRTTMVKAISSLMSIGSGASIGREGAITQLAAMLASKWGQLAKWQPYRLRLLAACGAASGISAAYNAPIAGAVFASLIVLGNFSMNLFAPLVFSSVVASMVSRSFFGVDPLYEVPKFEFMSVVQLPWFLILGLLIGVAGALFLKMLRWSEETFEKIAAPIYLRMVIGGLLVGALSMGYPQIWGNGYGVTNAILHDKFAGEHYLVLFLTGLVVSKLLATVLTVGAGAVGGVFTPTLFLGAGFGCIFGTGLHELSHGKTLPVSVFALVGMGCMLAATTRSPLLAMIMVFEISLDYSLMPPLMLACVVSTLVARRLHAESIYTEPLRKKGLAIDREILRPGSATEQTVGDLMRAPVPPLRETAPLHEIADRFLTSPNNFLPVVDGKQQLIGIVALQDLKEFLGAGSEMSPVIAYDVMRPPPATLTPDQLLLDTLPVMLASEQRNVPVVNSRSENRLVGAVVRAEVLGLLSEAIASRGEVAPKPRELALEQNQKEG